MHLFLSPRQVADIVYEANRRNVPLDRVITERREWWRKRRRFNFHDLCTLTTDKIAYGTSTAITITLNSLAASTTVGRQATTIDNTSNLYDDALVTAIITTSASAIGSSKTCYVYISGSEDGTNFDQDDGAMGASDAGYTINSPTNLKLGTRLYCPTSSKVYNRCFGVADLFRGPMPRKWLPVVTNDTNQALAASGNSMSYSGITYTNA